MDPHIPEQYPEDEFEYTEDPRNRRPPGGKPQTAEERLREKVDRVNMEAVLKKVLEGRISTAVDEAIKGRIEREVDAIFEEGWVATNQWGEPENDRAPVGIRARIATMLSKSNSYDRPSTADNIIQKEIKHAVEAAVETERRAFQKELKVWKREKMSDKLRAALDGSIF